MPPWPPDTRNRKTGLIEFLQVHVTKILSIVTLSLAKLTLNV